MPSNNAMSESSRSRQGSEDQPKPSRRRISHISKACNGCRRRKMKCDGGQPSCSICKVYNETCVYNPEQDGRRSAPKAYVAALEERVRVLERMLQSHGIDGESPVVKKEAIDPEGHSADMGLDRLKIDQETGELLEYGPTSVFNQSPDDSVRSPAGSGSASSPGGPTGLGNERPAALRPRPVTFPPLPAPELDPDTHEEVLQLFFNYFNTQSFWVSERRFRRDVAAAACLPGTVIRPRRTAFYSPLLHNIILAVGVCFLQIDPARREQLGAAFSRRAKDLIEEECESAMLSTVSGLFLLGTYHGVVARQSLGYLYAGIGLRLVQALGLGTNCSYWVENGSITEETRKARYHLFYVAYHLDKLWSTYVGRAPSLSISNHDIPVPQPDASEDDVLWQPIIQPTRSTDPFDPRIGQAAIEMSTTIAQRAEPVKSWRSSTFVWTCRLALINERVLNTVYSIGFDPASNNVRHIVSDLDVSVEKWLESLPDELRMPNTARGEARTMPSHILNLHMQHCLAVILLHRPWFAELKEGAESTADASVAKAERAAAKVLQVLAAYRKCPGLRYSPITNAQVTFTAGTVYLLSATHCTAKQSRKVKASIEGVQACIAALDEMGETLKCAAISARTLRRLLDQSYQRTVSPTPNPPPQPAAPTTDVERMLQNPAIAEQLLQLGWAPPPQLANQPQAPPTGPLSMTTLQPTPQRPTQPQIDWTIFGPLNVPATSATPAPLPAPTMTNLGGASPQSIYDMLSSSFSPTNLNVWPWQFLEDPQGGPGIDGSGMGGPGMDGGMGGQGV